MSIVTITGVEKKYVGPPSVTALATIDLSIESGTHTALMGPSGSGKSTLLHLIGALDTPTDGTVVVLGTDISRAEPRLRAAFRRSRLGFVFQAANLLPDRSVVENVELALLCKDGRRHAEHRQMARNALELVDLGHRWDAMPRHLSGGEQQRAAFARAVAAGPTLLIMDEPTGNLDSGSTGTLLDVVSAAIENQGITVVTATHDPGVAVRCDTVLTLRDGRLMS